MLTLFVIVLFNALAKLTDVLVLTLLDIILPSALSLVTDSENCIVSGASFTSALSLCLNCCMDIDSPYDLTNALAKLVAVDTDILSTNAIDIAFLNDSVEFTVSDICLPNPLTIDVSYPCWKTPPWNIPWNTASLVLATLTVSLITLNICLVFDLNV